MTGLVAALVAGVVAWALTRYVGIEYAIGYIAFSVASGKIAAHQYAVELAKGIRSAHRAVLTK